MEKTYYLSSKFSITTTKKLYIFMGAVFILNGMIMVFSIDFAGIGIPLGILNILLGVVFILLALSSFSPKSKYALRVNIDNDRILIKNMVFGKPEIFYWNAIDEIKFGLYELSITNENKIKKVDYDMFPDNSQELKKLIKNMAISKSISVITT